MKAILFLVLLGAACVFAASPPAAEKAQTRLLVGACTGCHGTDGHSNGAIPSLAGLKKEYIFLAMREFRAGKRASTVMRQQSTAYSDAQIERIAAFFAAQGRQSNR